MRRRWLGTLVLAPLLLGGCGAKSGTETAVPDPSGSPWVMVAAGKATSAPTTGGNAAPRSTMATGFLPLPSATATPTPTPSGTCPPANSRTINFASVVPGTTSAAVTFYNPGGPELVEYRVTAIPEDLKTGDQRDVGWTVLTPSGCGYMTATVTGLDRQTDYQFSVDAVTTQHDRDGTVSATVARSGVVRTA